MVEEDHDSALAIADEFFEWLDPDQMDEEETLYYNEEELLQLYAQLTSEWWTEEDDPQLHGSM